jgi:hypothetical protein
MEDLLFEHLSPASTPSSPALFFFSFLFFSFYFHFISLQILFSCLLFAEFVYSFSVGMVSMNELEGETLIAECVKET